MLTDTIDQYLIEFRTASEQRRFEDTTRLLEQLKARLKASPPDPSEVIHYFEKIIAGDPIPGSGLAFIAGWYNRSAMYQEPLCRIVEAEECRDFHEPAVELLAEVGDAHAIPALTKALGYRWDYDQWLHVPRKALRALRTIGTSDAFAIIRQATASPDQLLSDEAKALLDNA